MSNVKNVKNVQDVQDVQNPLSDIESQLPPPPNMNAGRSESYVTSDNIDEFGLNRNDPNYQDLFRNKINLNNVHYEMMQMQINNDLSYKKDRRDDAQQLLTRIRYSIETSDIDDAKFTKSYNRFLQMTNTRMHTLTALWQLASNNQVDDILSDTAKEMFSELRDLPVPISPVLYRTMQVSEAVRKDIKLVGFKGGNAKPTRNMKSNHSNNNINNNNHNHNPPVLVSSNNVPTYKSKVQN